MKRLYSAVDKEVFITGIKNGNEHRMTARVDLALQISVHGQEGEAINISASGYIIKW